MALIASTGREQTGFGAGAVSAEALRQALGINPTISVRPCIAKDDKAVKAVLLTLIYAILDEIDRAT